MTAPELDPAEIARLMEAAQTEFADYFRRNYPGPDTIIGKPDWHSPKIFRSATHRLRAALERAYIAAPTGAAVPDDAELDALVARLLSSRAVWTNDSGRPRSQPTDDEAQAAAAITALRARLAAAEARALEPAPDTTALAVEAMKQAAEKIALDERVTGDRPTAISLEREMLAIAVCKATANSIAAKIARLPSPTPADLDAAALARPVVQGLVEAAQNISAVSHDVIMKWGHPGGLKNELSWSLAVIDALKDLSAAASRIRTALAALTAAKGGA